MNFWLLHILIAAILYTSAMGVGLLHGHPHHHDGNAEIHAAAHADHGQDGDHPCTRTDCDSHACCSAHSHHLLAVGAAVCADVVIIPTGFHAEENRLPLSRYLSDIFHPPESC